MSEQKIFNFATIGEVFEDGVSLIFDGQDTATEKHYKVNTSIVFKAGDRVKIFPDSGTYVVEYIVGSPLVGGSDEGGSDEGEETPALIPSGGTAGQALIKLTDADNDYGWGTVPGTLPAGGGVDRVPIKRTIKDYDYYWGEPLALGVVDQYYTTDHILFKTDRYGNFFIKSSESTIWSQITVV